MPPRHILTHNRKRKAELKSFLLLMKSINANSYRKSGTKSLEKTVVHQLYVLLETLIRLRKNIMLLLLKLRGTLLTDLSYW